MSRLDDCIQAVIGLMSEVVARVDELRDEVEELKALCRAKNDGGVAAEPFGDLEKAELEALCSAKNDGPAKPAQVYQAICIIDAALEDGHISDQRHTALTDALSHMLTEVLCLRDKVAKLEAERDALRAQVADLEAEQAVASDGWATTAERDALIVSLRRDRHTQVEIAARVGVSQSLVSKVLTRLAILSVEAGQPAIHTEGLLRDKLAKLGIERDELRAQMRTHLHPLPARRVTAERRRCVEVVQWCREEGVTDLRQVLHWIKSGDEVPDGE